MAQEIVTNELTDSLKNRAWCDRAGWEWTWNPETEVWDGISRTGSRETATTEELNGGGFGPFQEVRW